MSAKGLASNAPERICLLPAGLGRLLRPARRLVTARWAFAHSYSPMDYIYHILKDIFCQLTICKFLSGFRDYSTKLLLTKAKRDYIIICVF